MGAAKAALEALVRYFAVALAQRGITVNPASPGWTEDSVLNLLPPAAQIAIRDWHTQGWITGQLIVADGGASLMNSEVTPALQHRLAGPPRAELPSSA